MLSIIIPTLNEADNMKRLAERIRPQLRGGDEVIVVDGHSPDGTAALALAAGFRVILQDPQGIGGAKTEGAKHAKNEVLVFLDADGFIQEDHLSRIRGHFSTGEVDAVGGVVWYLASSPWERFLCLCYSKLMFHIPKVIYRLTGKYGLPANNIAIRRDIFMGIGGYRSVVGEDFDFMLRMPPSRRVRYDGEMGVGLSARRFEEKGFLRTVTYWLVFGASNVVGRGHSGAGYRH